MGDGEKSPDIEAGNNRDSNVVNLSLDWSDPAQGKQLLQPSTFLLKEVTKVSNS
jgi:hypothetical protein